MAIGEWTEHLKTRRGVFGLLNNEVFKGLKFKVHLGYLGNSRKHYSMVTSLEQDSGCVGMYVCAVGCVKQTMHM